MVALIKKDKPEPELKDSMEQQMEVFLQENTVSFIESLFKALESKEYLEGPPKTLKKIEAEADLEEDGKPDSTTSTPANIGELSSDLKEAEHRSTRRTSDVRKPHFYTFCLNVFIQSHFFVEFTLGTFPHIFLFRFFY